MNRLVDTITLQEAVKAVEKYNRGYYRNKLNTVLDQEGYQLFKDHLGSNLNAIEKQVYFIGKDYGGVGFQLAIQLSGVIANKIFIDRQYFVENAVHAIDLIQCPVSLDVLCRLYEPFIQQFHGRSNWHTWATKFMHFINPNAFPIQDSRVNECFNLTSNSPQKYHKLMQEFGQYLSQHYTWLPTLREADEGFSWSDLKLLDKVFYSIGEVKKCTS